MEIQLVNEVECACDDWDENIALVNAPVQLQYIRTGHAYEGKRFTHCPWCGKGLRQKVPALASDSADTSLAK
jgi:hypothetical protein